MNQADQIADAYDILQQDTFYLLVDTFKTTRPQLVDKDHILEWRLKALSKIGALTKQVIALVSKQSGKSKRQIYDLIQKDGLTVAKQMSQDLASALRVSPRGLSEDTVALIDSYAHQTFRNVDNYCNQSLLTTNYGKNGAVRAYQEIIDKTVLDVTTGLKTPYKALKDNIYQWRDVGLKTTLVDKGGHEWHLEPYTRMVIETTTSRVFNDARMQSMKEFDTVLATMTSHPAARPACAPIQGKVVCIVPKSDPRCDSHYPNIYDHGYGKPAGTQGINCSHMLYPYIKGVSHNFQEHFDPKKAVENAKIQQQQRYYERNVRRLKRTKQLAERLDDQEKITSVNQQIRAYQAKIRQIVKDHDFLNRQYDREQIINGK